MIKRLLRRSSIHFAGLLVAKVVGTLVFILLARLLAPSIFGEVAYYITIVSVVTIVGDCGLVQWYQKKSVTEPRDRLLGRLVAARLSTALLSVVMVIAYAWSLSRYSGLLSALLVLTILPEALLSVFDGFYLAEKKPLPISFKQLVRSLFLLAGGLLFGATLTVEKVAILVFLSSIVNIFWFVPASHLQLIKKDVWAVPQTLWQSIYYAVLITTSYAYSRGDSIIIQKTLGSAALGWYSVAYRYLEGLSMIPTALAQNLFHEAAKEGAVTRQQLLRITALLFGLGFVSMVVVISLAEFLTVTILGPAYAPATELVRMLAIVSFLFFCNAPLGAVVQSSRLLSAFVPWGIANTALNIALNIVFVPVYGVIAAAYIMIITELIGCAINLWFARKLYQKNTYVVA